MRTEIEAQESQWFSEVANARNTTTLAKTNEQGLSNNLRLHMVKQLHSENESSGREAPTMDELIKDFLQESAENLDRLDQDFVRLETQPSDPDLLKSIFRTTHTIKGPCGFLGFTKLESLRHAAESLLFLLRDGKIALNQEITDVLLETVDAVRQYLHEIEASGTEGDKDPAQLVAKLKTLQEAAPEETATSTRRIGRGPQPGCNPREARPSAGRAGDRCGSREEAASPVSCARSRKASQPAAQTSRRRKNC